MQEIFSEVTVYCQNIPSIPCSAENAPVTSSTIYTTNKIWNWYPVIPAGNSDKERLIGVLNSIIFVSILLGCVKLEDVSLHGTVEPL